jgi:hypothetical protein
MEVVRFVAVALQTLLEQCLFLALYYLPGGVAGMDLYQIASSLASVGVEAGMGYPRILID